MGINYSKIKNHQIASVYVEYNSFLYLLVETSKNILDLGFLYGYTTNWNPFLFKISSGLSFTAGNKFGKVLNGGGSVL